MRTKLLFFLAVLTGLVSVYLVYGGGVLTEPVSPVAIEEPPPVSPSDTDREVSIENGSSSAEEHLMRQNLTDSERVRENGMSTSTDEGFDGRSQGAEAVSMTVERESTSTTSSADAVSHFDGGVDGGFDVQSLSVLDRDDEERAHGRRRAVLEGGRGRRAPDLLFQGEGSQAIFDNDNPEEAGALPRVGGQSRGYALLYAMQPEARKTVERQVEAMLASNVRDLFIAVLTDGTFSKDFDYLRSIIARLSSEGRRLTLLVYLTNGPTMRDYDTTEITAGFNQINPDEFREMIRLDPSTRQEFLEMVAEVKPLLEFNRSTNTENRNLVSVMLEDNLDNASYVSMRNLARSVLGNLVEYVRNPCPGCFQGNEWDPSGDILELHSVEALHALRQGDGFTTDGESYYFEGSVPHGLSIEELKLFKTQSMEQGLSYFALWKRERQGLYDDSRPHPSSRSYEIPSPSQITKEINLLRHGLSEVD